MACFDAVEMEDAAERRESAEQGGVGRGPADMFQRQFRRGDDDRMAFRQPVGHLLADAGRRNSWWC